MQSALLAAKKGTEPTQELVVGLEEWGWGHGLSSFG